MTRVHVLCHMGRVQATTDQVCANTQHLYGTMSLSTRAAIMDCILSRYCLQPPPLGLSLVQLYYYVLLVGLAKTESTLTDSDISYTIFKSRITISV